MAAVEANVLQKDNWKSFLSTYNKVTEHCFLDCVHDFKTRKVSPLETSCASNCLQMYMKVSQRVDQRTMEFQTKYTNDAENTKS
ncbi:mitochondrial import inner membrane translocase subunit Tim9-like [Ylistrum balloti]|uniref:mitochondrial import inner membrane translocase subunit Tim9-like n=1 Tax=Ylistrum balloti TaxID=509963 RepID=UPI0029059629|nr:mitochondrial import inner membrane translocase subunit Tim9-like [Ylistrum balloti]